MSVYPSKEYFIEEYVKKGKTRVQLAEENGVSVATIKSHLRSKKITKPPLIDEEILRTLYVDEKKTIKDIALILGHDRNAISRAIKTYKIRRENHYVQYDDTFDDEWIRLYVEEKLSTFKIADMYGVSHTTVKKHLIHCGIEIRDKSKAQRASKNKHSLSSDLSDYSTMYKLYVEEQRTLKELGEIYGCSPGVIRRCLVKLNIPIKTQSEVKIGLLTGANHPNWKGGLCTLTQRLREYHNTNLAPLCRERDGYTCQLCGKHSHLHAHHCIPFSWIVDNQLQMHPELDVTKDCDALYEIIVHDETFLDLSNLITLCRDCHLFVVHGYKKTISSQAAQAEGSTTIPEGSTP